jgi:hypothetical protein
MSVPHLWMSLIQALRLTARQQRPRQRKSPSFEQLENRLTPAAPVVLFFTPATPVIPYTNATSVTYSLLFGESVTGVDANDFKISVSGALQTASPVVVTGTGAQYSVKINGILGSGDLRVDLIDNDSISSGGGPLGGAGLNNGSFQSGAYHILQTFPSVVSINRATPASTATNGATVSFTVTFSTAVTGVDSADFAPLATTGTVAAGQPQVSGSGSVYTVTVSGITGEGTLGINLVDNGSIRDSDGRPLSTWSAPVSFLGQQSFAASVVPIPILAGEISGDGKVDLVVVNRNASSISVLLGNGDGSYKPQVETSAGTLPRWANIGDLNGDGKPDLVLGNNNGTVSVLLSNGNGTFQAQQTFGAAGRVFGVAIGDVNGDGKPDIATGNYQAGSVGILLGNGNGTFQSQVTYALAGEANGVTLADLNGDGKLDLAVAASYSSAANVLLGNGDGTFQPRQTFATGNSAGPIAVGDVNGDGKPDMAVSNYVTSSVSILLGNGNGTFQGHQIIGTDIFPRSIAFGDLNGDGKLDLTSASVGNGTVSVLLGNGNGTFQARTTFSVGDAPRSMVLTDLNADGKLDVAVANSLGEGSGTVILGSRNGAFVGQTFSIDHIGPTASVVPISPDPRFNAVGAVTLNFNEPVQNLDISDLTLTRNGSSVPLTAAMLSGSGSQYALDLTTATSSGGNVTLGTYVLTMNTSDIKDLAGNALSSGATDSWQIIAPFSTTTTLSATPNATTGGQLVTFTATISPSPGAVGTVTFKDNGVAIPNATNVPVTGGVATFQISILTAGMHPISAAFNGGLGYLPSNSNTMNFTVAAAQPLLPTITPNGNIAAWAATPNQRSRVVSLLVVFNQPVQLDQGAMAIALHTNSVVLNGVAKPNGLGAAPNSLSLATTDNVTWVVTFNGNTEPGGDTLNSLVDGVYDFSISAAKVHPVGVPNLNMVANALYTFHRLYGDTDAPSTPGGGTAGVDYQAIVNTGDNIEFRTAFNRPAPDYKPYLDFDGSGLINTGDNIEFRSRFNQALTWRV